MAFNNIINDNFFKSNPEKVLGEPYQTTTMYGEVTRWRGDVSKALDKVNLGSPNYELAEIGSSAYSEEYKPITAKSILNVKEKANIQRALRKAAKQTLDLKIGKDISNIEMLSFDDVDTKYNGDQYDVDEEGEKILLRKAITLEEKEIFVYHMRENEGRPMKGGWLKYDIIERSYNGELDLEERLNQIVESGAGSYDGKMIVPTFIYLSGNVFQTMTKTQANRLKISDRFGESVLKRQLESLTDIAKGIDEKRLTLAPKVGAINRLVLEVNNDFVKRFMISSLQTDKQLSGIEYEIEDGILTRIEYRRNSGGEPILQAPVDKAYWWWLRKYSQITSVDLRMDIKFGLNFWDLYEIMTGRARKPQSVDPKQWEVKKKKAKIEHKRLFAYFLANVLTDQDRISLEIEFNRKFDSDVAIDFDKAPIPIGFKMSKYYGSKGFELDIREKQQSAIRAAMLRSSLCVAYGVGLGKTLSSIFIMAQFIENGWCTNPLLAVPNQVYPQFKREIISSIPHVPVFELGNMSVDFVGAISEDATFFHFLYENKFADKLKKYQYSKEDKKVCRIPDEFVKMTKGKPQGVYAVDQNKLDYSQEFIAKLSEYPCQPYFVGVEDGEVVSYPFISYDENKQAFFKHKPDEKVMIEEISDRKTIGNSIQKFINDAPNNFQKTLFKFASSFSSEGDRVYELNDFGRAVKLFDYTSKGLPVLRIESEFDVKVGKKLPEGVITITTYEGFKRLGVSDDFSQDLFFRVDQILNQSDKRGDLSQRNERSIEIQKRKASGFLGKAYSNTIVGIDTLGIDFICIDEAHSAKKVFESVKGESMGYSEETDGYKRKPSRYKISAGTSSVMGCKTFLMSQYCQYINPVNKNVFLLTATPFTNSPIEIFSMLSLIGYDYLKKLGINTLENFFDNYVEVESVLSVKANLSLESVEKFVGFNNLQALQKLIRRFFLYEKEARGIVRPNLFVLPYKGKKIDGLKVEGGKKYEASSILPPTDVQAMMLKDIIDYVDGADMGYGAEWTDSKGKRKTGFICNGVDYDPLEYKNIKMADSEGDDETAKSIAILRGLTFARAVSYSPYLFTCYERYNLPEINYKDFVELSSKLKYTMDCVKSIKKAFEDKGEAVGGQIIYTNVGADKLSYLKEYLVKEVGFEEYEIGIASGSSSVEMTSKQEKEDVQHLFLGRKYNEITEKYEPIPDKYRIKVLIGTSSITEGINLQDYCCCIYNLYVDWNPTDNEQLKGRGWRDGNNYKNMRMVFPLVEDSMDIFIFQKQEEKTRRINMIWDFDGQSSQLDLSEFNPEELKYELIKDPARLAELEIINEKGSISEDVDAFRLKITQLTNASIECQNLIRSIESLESYLEDYAVEYLDLDPNDVKQEALSIERMESRVNIISKANKVLSIFKNREKEVKKKYRSISKSLLSVNEVESYQDLPEELKEEADKIDQNLTSNSLIKSNEAGLRYIKAEKDLKYFESTYNKVLVPSNIEDTLSKIDEAIKSTLEQSKELEKTLKSLDDDNYKAQKIAQIQTKQMIDAQGKEVATISTRVQEFENLNYLLFEKRGQHKHIGVFLDEPNVEAEFKIGESKFFLYKGNYTKGEVREIFYRKDKEPLYSMMFMERATHPDTREKYEFIRFRLISESEFKDIIKLKEKEAAKMLKQKEKAEKKSKEKAEKPKEEDVDIKFQIAKAKAKAKAIQIRLRLRKQAK
jgi:hypothetical protein